MDLNLLRVFLAVYEARSVGGAAHALGMSQPGLSTALARLRKQLGDPLFLRGASGMEPTSRGRDLAESVRTIMRSIDDVVLKPPVFDPATSRREFRIALSDIAEGIYLPTVLQALEASASHMSLRSVFMTPRQLEAEMAAGTVDIAAGYYPDIKGSAFMHRRIALHSFACIAHKHHAGVGDRMTMEQFSTLPHVVVEATGRSQELFDRFLQKRRITRRVILRSPHFMSVPFIVADSDAVAVVPQALADFVADHPLIKQVALPFRPPVFQVNLYWHRSAHADPANQWLRQVLIRQFPLFQARAYDRNGRPEARA
ncbi:LysR family transcriptional regulator [Variovorax guangxiensis]|uniref:LysR family transcriptional regulator n=1 Tax=Variovorax guangxiensis TaxID=1775474 RepID=UPI00285B20D2|nr:LysR family transcriptional regulator [Variovorax guangxiensis]MDR6860745.1 DNA-binding transcriptional LysR family regulator [Variovorax guangxiensis]